MKSPVVKRSIVIAGHKTSVSLEDAFWQGLKEIAGGRDMTLSDLVAAIDTERQHGNLSSAIRLFVLDYYRNQLSDDKDGRDGTHEIWPARGLVDVLVGRISADASCRTIFRVKRTRPRGRVDLRRLSALPGTLCARPCGGVTRAGPGRPNVHRRRQGRCLPGRRCRLRPSAPWSVRTAAAGAGSSALGACGMPALAAPAGLATLAAAQLVGRLRRRCGAGAAPAARPSSTSSFFDCCSTARSASQLVSAATSMVRFGASIGPFSAITTSGRVLAGASDAGRSRQAQPRIESAVGEIDASADTRSALCARTMMLPRRACPALIVIAPSASGNGKAAAGKRGIHPVSDSDRVDRQALIDRTDHGVECRRIEPHQTGLFELEGAAAAERADERDRAHPGPLGLYVERQPAAKASHRREATRRR